MSVRIIIKNTPIDIPEQGDSQPWGPAVTEALQALADAVNVSTGAYDLPPQVFNIDSYNGASNITIDNLYFPPTEVLSAFIMYGVKRQTQDSGAGDAQNVSEEGTLEIVYSETNPVSNKWQISRSSMGDASITFAITDLGQVQFSNTALSGIGHSASLSFRALSINKI
jgi:hypothetical protein